MYELTYGLILPGFYVCHDCPGGDRPECCNYRHLWLGTSADNTKDASEKKQMSWGIHHPQAKLNEQQIRMIRETLGTRGVKTTGAAIAKELGISMGHVYDIAHRRVWQHLP